MPRIAAASVAEHRANQRRALLLAARELVLERGFSELTFAALAHRTGLARPSIYEYFPTREELAVVLCEQELPRWLEPVEEAVGRARSPWRKIEAYVRSQLDLVARGEHRLAMQLAGVELGPEARERIHALHDRVQPPLAKALATSGHPHPDLAAALVQGVVSAAAVRIESGDPPARVVRAALDLLRNGAAGRLRLE
ncbi:MAG: TetR/AcrR family transcriptional regulator [Acidimicrobiales bacterium]